MHIGVDFDNTIVSYDPVFYRVCRERGWIPENLRASKSLVRDYLRSTGRAEDWTELQGLVYGTRMAEAEAFPGVKDFFMACRSRGIELSIISHKTRQPYLGQAYDLHQAALSWLEEQGFTDPAVIGLPRSHVCFALTKAAKLEQIAAVGCTHFIDDLPEFLAEADFPAAVERLLFDPHNHFYTEQRFVRRQSWAEIHGYFQLPPPKA